jgi:ubiquinone/menaquinone biosynthesis C-methylase UbiE
LSLYRRWIVPRLTHLSMRQDRLVPYRMRTIAGARGRVLEIGIGSALNLRLYGASVEGVLGIDPSLEMLRLACGRVRDTRLPVSLVDAPAEELPVASASVDTVVSTWTMCCIPEPERALGEMRRVLRPGGRLLFVEHGRAPEPGVARWQDRLNAGWRCLAGGCNLNRAIDDLVRAGGFRIGELHAAYAEGPKLLAYLYRGWAEP